MEMMDLHMSDMGSTTTTTSPDLMSMMMNMQQFHASGGDTLWISPFVPFSPASVFGACILLFFIGFLSRFIDALQRTTTLIWAASQSSGVPVIWTARHELPRGALFLIQSGLLYLLMLAVMTYNAYYFVSILIGLGIGETCFGRYGRPTLQCRPNNDIMKDLHLEGPERTDSCCEKGQ